MFKRSFETGRIFAIEGEQIDHPQRNAFLVWSYRAELVGINDKRRRKRNQKKQYRTRNGIAIWYLTSN